ncbi:hypothetical protein ACFWZR_04595 [Streptomyces sp. NPDC059017]|uniref:hypothetical protein n=1 Tax=unclassified Streptomyces TaxID=2593676 RepID=UPI0036CC9D6A
MIVVAAEISGMRIRSLTAALAGSLAFAALAVPSAYAAADGDIVITDVAVSGGGDFAIGGSKTFNVSVTAQDDSGIQTMGLHIRVPG